MGLNARKPVLEGFANNKGADQPEHPRSLISTFVIPFLKSILSNLDTSEILLFLLGSEAQHAGLNLTLSETPCIAAHIIAILMAQLCKIM